MVNTSSALIAFKPDAVSMSYFGKGVRLLAQGLSAAGINFRLLSPQVVYPTGSDISRLYPEHVGQPWFVQRHLPFMAGTHPNPLVKHSPLITMVVQAEDRGLDLYGSLSDIVGPTNPLSALNSAQDQLSQDRIIASMRYQLTLGSGSALHPLERDNTSPLYNRLHRSESDNRAANEIAALYRTGVVRVPFQDFEGMRGEDIGAAILNSQDRRYQGFGVIQALFLGNDIQRTMPLILAIEENFLANLGRSQVIPLSDEAVFPDNGPSFILGLSGVPGSGKTTIANHLIANAGLRSLVHVTTYRSEAEAASGEDYYYLSEPEFMEMLYQGELIGCTRFPEIPGKYYSLLRTSVEDVMESAGSGIAVSGISVLNYLQHLVSAHPTARFRSMYILPPDVQAVIDRHKARARAGDEDRYQYLDQISHRMFARADSFDKPIVNDVLPIALAEAEDYVRQAMAGETPESKPLPQNTRVNPLVIGHQCASMFRALHTQIEGLDVSSFAPLKEALAATVGVNLDSMMTNIKRDLLGVTHLSPSDKADVDAIVDHTLGVLAAALQAGSASRLVLTEPGGLGNLAIDGSPQRVAATLSAISDLCSRLTPDEMISLAVLHDVGKLIELFRHPELGDQVLDPYELTGNTPGSAVAQKDIMAVAVLYHHAIGSIISSDFSPLIFRDMFSSPRVMQITCNADGSVNKEAALRLMDYLLFSAITDVAGRPGPRGLRNLLVEGYIKAHQRVVSLINENSGNFEGLLRGIERMSAELNTERLGSLIGMADQNMDRFPEGFAHYERTVTISAQNAIALGTLSTQEWEYFCGHFQSLNGIWYCPFTTWAKYDATTGTFSEADPQSVNTNFIRFSSHLLKGVNDTVCSLGSSPTIELEFKDPEGRFIMTKEAIRNFSMAIDRIVSSADLNSAVMDGNTMFFLDSHGTRIPGLKVDVTRKGPVIILTVRLE